MPMKPTIHLNGTSKNALLEQQTDAIDAIQTAMEKLGEAAPNGRDYYPQGNTAIYTAQHEHEARMAKLREVKAELEEIAMAIADAGSR